MDNSNFYHIPNVAVGARHPINSRRQFVGEVAAVGAKADRAWGVSLLPEKGNYRFLLLPTQMVKW